MNIVKSTCSDIFELDSCQDYEEVLDYSIYYSVTERATSTEYFVDDVVLPSTKSGIYLQCVQPGVSSASAVTFSTQKGTRTTDGTVIWKTIPGKLLLQASELITSSAWSNNIPLEVYHSGITGSIKIGDRVLGDTSGAIGTIALKSTDLSIFIRNITGTFVDTELISVIGIDDEVTGTGSATITTVESAMGSTQNPSFTDYSTTIWLGPVDKRLTSVTLTNTIETSSSPVRTIERSIKIPLNEK